MPWPARWRQPYGADYEEYPDTDLIPGEVVQAMDTGYYADGFARMVPRSLAAFSNLTYNSGQPSEGQVVAKRGIIGVSAPGRTPKRARRSAPKKETLVLTMPIGNKYRTVPFSSALNFGAVPCQYWHFGGFLFDWDPSNIVYAYQQAASGATAVTDWKTTNLTPYHETFTGATAWPLMPIGTYASGGAAHIRQAQILRQLDSMRFSGNTFFCTLQLDLRFIVPEQLRANQLPDYRLRVIMIQIDEETSITAANSYTLGNFYDFYETSLYSYQDHDVPRIANYMKTETVEAEMNSYTVLIDQIVDVRSLSTSITKPHLTLRQPMGAIEIDESIDLSAARPVVRKNRANRIVWGIFQVNTSETNVLSGAPAETNNYFPEDTIQYHGNWKLIFNDANF